MRLSWASTEQLRRHGVRAVRLLKTCVVSRICVCVCVVNQGNVFDSGYFTNN